MKNYRESNLKPELVEFLEMLEEMPVRLVEMPHLEARKMLAEKNAVPEEEQEPVGKILDRAIESPHGTVPLRIYVPEGEGPFPVVVHFHGGGWVFGSIDLSSPLCRSVARRTPCVVVSVGYHLSPEYTYPVAVDDCYAAVKWVARHAGQFGGDPQKLGVMGQSAGGNLAAVMCLMARDKGGPDIRFQLLNYPVVTADVTRDQKCLDQTFLTVESMDWYFSQYLGTSKQRDEPYVSPLRAKDVGDLPPGFAVIAEHDCLTPDALKYVERVANLEGKVYEGMIHSFLEFPFEVTGREAALDEMCERLRAGLA